LLVWEPHFVAAFRGARRAAGRPAQHPRHSAGAGTQWRMAKGLFVAEKRREELPSGQGEETAPAPLRANGPLAARKAIT